MKTFNTDKNKTLQVLHSPTDIILTSVAFSDDRNTDLNTVYQILQLSELICVPVK